jgi:uroporphyrinogen-III synthase
MKDQPLAGFTVGVTDTGGHEELTARLERRGARVVHAPAVRLVPLTEDADLREATRAVLAGPIDDVVLTAGSGLLAWLETATGWGLGDDLAKNLAGSRILACGPRGCETLRAAGMAGRHTPADGADEALRRLLGEDLSGRRVAVQLFGGDAVHLVAPLRRAGAEVVEVPMYRWARADDPTPLRRLVGQAVAGTIDAITFAGASEVAATLAVAAGDDLDGPLLMALRTHVVAACAGRSAAAALAARDVATVLAKPATVAALDRALATELPERQAGRITVAGHALELRGHAVVLDGRLRPIAPTPMAILRALARHPGHVVSRTELCGVLPGRAPVRGSRPGRPYADEHAVEMAVARLRRALGRSDLVETVVKRGYRLACDSAERHA